MSQQKVESRKQDKLNRKNDVKKEKMQRGLIIAAAIVVLLAVIGWAGYSIYQKASSANSNANETVDVNIDAISDFVDNLE